MRKFLYAIRVQAIQSGLGFVCCNVSLDGIDKLIESLILGEPIDGIRTRKGRVAFELMNDFKEAF
jgi:hypothetical protein